MVLKQWPIQAIHSKDIQSSTFTYYLDLWSEVKIHLQLWYSFLFYIT